jgi:hypothetical protein
VTIDLKDLELTNSLNINPGDNDPSVAEDAAEGTEHTFTYDVYNTGNKSIRTRHTIILTANEAGESEVSLDARYLALFQEGTEIASKTYVLSDGSEVSDLSGVTKSVKAVKYVFISDVFDGKGTSLDKNGDAEKETLTGVVQQNDAGDVTKEYSYDLSLLVGASNEYQACDVEIEVLIEAMQYRNTTDDDWSEAAIVVKQFSSEDVSLDVVPASNEDRKGNIIQ